MSRHREFKGGLGGDDLVLVRVLAISFAFLPFFSRLRSKGQRI